MKAVLLAMLLLLLPDGAFAGPIVAAAIAGQAITAIMIAEFGVTLALSFGLSYVAGKLLSKPSDIPTRAPVGGIELDIRLDAGVPRALLVGTAVTAGSLCHVGTYGKRDRIDNSDAIEIIALADHPCEALLNDGIFVDGKKQGFVPNLASDKGGVIEGMRITDYKRKLFFKFYDGTQTQADDLAVAKLTGSHPWTANMVGQGVTYIRVHAIYHPTLVTNLPQWKFVVKGAKLYDLRKDTTAGGSGGHRFTTLSTHAWTENPMVIAYNILRGIYVADGAGTRRHFYGLKRTAADQLPFDEWVAAMNACDEPSSLTDATARYRAGGEISVDTEPFEVIKELLKCCGGRMTELGGIYKPYVDAPGLPDFEFEDDDVLDAEDRFSPILPLEQRVNYITGSYTSPVRRSEKIAPPRENATYETEDGRRLPAELTAPMVQYKPQMQRLMKQYLKRARRARKHIVSLPPRYFGIEAGQVLSWTSTRNGYIDKLFDVDGVEYHSNLCITVSLTEIDPADYDWEPGVDLIDEDDDEWPSIIPDPKAVTGFAAVGVTELGDDGTKKPGIQFTWSPPEDGDVIRIVFQIRRPSLPTKIYTCDHNDPEDGTVVVVAGLAPNTIYEVRARSDSRSGYESDWTNPWLSVVTPNAKFSTKDFETALKEEIDHGINDKIALVEAANEEIAMLLNALQSDVELNRTDLIQFVKNVRTGIIAAYTNAITVATGPDSAIGQSLEGLEVQVGDIKANTKAQFVVGVTPQGAISAYDLKVIAHDITAGMQLVARQTQAGVKSAHVRFDVDSFMIGKNGQTTFQPVFVLDTTDPLKPQILFKGEMLALSLKAARAFIGSLSAITANLGTVTAGRMRFSSTLGEIDITSNPPRILISKVV